MRFFNTRFPYTSMNNINLDWIIKKVKALGTDTVEAQTAAQEAQTAAQEAQTAAQEAQTTAQEAQTAAQEAHTTAQEAQATAQEAQTTADSIASTAEAAQTAAAQALTAAQYAQTAAQAAQTAVAAKQDAPSTPGAAGQVLGLDSNLSPVWVPQSGGGGGTSDYADLANKPSINGVTLSGDKTSADLSLASASDLAAVSTTAQAAQTAAQAAQTTAGGAAGTAVAAQTAASQALATAQAAQTTADGKQDAITATGMLYRSGDGTIRAGVRGTEYAARKYAAILTASAWSTDNEQSIGNAEWFNNANYYYIVGPAPDSLEEWAGCGVYAVEFLSNGGFKFKCTTQPANNLTVQIIRGTC